MFRHKTNAGGHKSFRKLRMLSKIAVTACLGLSLTLTTVYAEEDGSLEKIYHVYVDGKHVGKVDNTDNIEDLMNTKVENKEKDYDNLSLVIGEDVSFVSERIFDPEYNNSSLADSLKDNLSVKAEAVELTVADKTVGYFKDEETAKNVLQAYKEQFVDKKALENLTIKEQDQENDAYEAEALINENQDDVTLETGDSIITDVTLSENVSLSDEKVSPDNVLTEKEGLKKLEKGTREKQPHEVEKGEVLSDIGESYGLTVDEILELNDGLNKDSTLQIGQEINVTDYTSFVDVTVNKEKVAEETIDYETKTVESDDLYKGEEKVKQEGQKGKKEVHAKLKMTNGNVVEEEILEEETTEEPQKKIIVKGTKVVPSRGTGNLDWPAVGGHISSPMGERWGSMHEGIDIAGPSERSILAADNGTVTSAGRDGGYGNKVVIDHNNGMKTTYAHLSSISVSPGQTVEKGRKIGVMGTTGNSTGIHLHFEVYMDGSLKNPQDYL